MRPGLARSLLRRSRQGALATLMAGSGDPYCSLVNVASHPDGSPILLISRLAVHTQKHPGRFQGLPDAGRARRGRPAGGVANHAGGPGRGGRRRPIWSFCADATSTPIPPRKSFVDFKDFSFFRIRPQRHPSGGGFRADRGPQPRAVLDRYFRCRRAAGSRAGRHRAHERRSSRRDRASMRPGCSARSLQTGAAPAAIPMGSTCRPEQ